MAPHSPAELVLLWTTNCGVESSSVVTSAAGDDHHQYLSQHTPFDECDPRMKSLNRSLKSTINLGNSIIGVSILAMPLCFRQCGILLSLLVLGLSALLNQFSCYLLLKSAIINRRKNYELLAYDVFGAGGKTLVEICILLYLLGTCVAFFVIVGDIAPSLVAHLFNLDNGPHLRTLIVTGLGMFVIFPLGLMRNVESLTSFSMISLGVYVFLALRMISLAFDKFFTPTAVNILTEVNYWDSSYVISYLPIFSMALSCQGQIFEIFQQDLFQAEHRSLKYMMRSTKRAIYITSIMYILIGLFGYFAFFDVAFTGNILQSLPSGFATKMTLLLFLITLLTSFPLCLFPCRTSLHSLLFRRGHGYSDVLSTAHSAHMSDHHFRLLTMLLIVTTMSCSIIFPHVELVLALVGSTIGAVCMFIIPALIFIKLSDKNTIEYLFSYLLVFFGTIILVFCTFSAIHSISLARDVEIEEKINEIKQKSTVAWIPPKMEAPEKVKNLPPVVVTSDFKSNIKNITKLRESVKMDMKKLKKQDEILQRLEKQQQEHSQLLKEQREIINELKSHDKIFHEDKKMTAVDVKANLTVDKDSHDAPKKSVPEVPVKRSFINASEVLAAPPNVIYSAKSDALHANISTAEQVRLIEPAKPKQIKSNPVQSNSRVAVSGAVNGAPEPSAMNKQLSNQSAIPSLQTVVASSPPKVAQPIATNQKASKVISVGSSAKAANVTEKFVERSKDREI